MPDQLTSKLLDPSSLAVGGGGRDTQLASRLRVTEQRLADLTKRQASTQAELERVTRESVENAKRAQQLEMSLSSKVRLNFVQILLYDVYSVDNLCQRVRDASTQRANGGEHANRRR